MIEITISLAAHAASGKPPRDVVIRTSVLVGRYLNTLRLDPDTGSEQHDELDAAAVALLDAAVVVGLLGSEPAAWGDGRLKAAIDRAAPLASLYLLAANRKHNPGRAVPPLPPPAKPPALPPLPRAYTEAERLAIDRALPKVYRKHRA